MRGDDFVRLYAKQTKRLVISCVLLVLGTALCAGAIGFWIGHWVK